MVNVEWTTRLESFKEEIHQAFMAYAKHATGVLAQQPHSKETAVNTPIRLVHQDSTLALRSLAAQAEDSSQYKNLVSTLERASGQYPSTGKSVEEMNRDEVQSLRDYLDLIRGILGLSNFFRRSRFYLNAYSGKKQSIEELFNILWSRLRGEYSAKTTNLSILDEVAFASRCLDFGTFKIQMFNERELDVLTGQEVNNVFYPLAQLDTDFLSRYWFLVEDPSSGLADERIAGVDDEDDRDKREQWRRIKLQMPQPSINLLAVYNWQREFDDDALAELRATGEEYRESLGWTGFIICKTLAVSDNLFEAPSPLPNVTAESGLLVGFEILITEEQESEIREVVAKGQRLVQIAQAVRPRWDFVENAMGYLGKAFLATPNLEQLLWNTIVIECLLSEKKDITKSMRHRIGNILGGTGEARSKVKEEFEEVYEFRCDFVHGNRFDRKAQFNHLAQARDLAQRVMSWFVDYLLWVDDFLQKHKVGYQRYPQRDQLLARLDGDTSSLNQLNRAIDTFASQLSKNFKRQVTSHLKQTDRKTE